MQYVAYIPVFLAVIFGGGYLFDQAHKEPTTQEIVQPIEKNLPEPQPTPTPEPVIEKKTVSVPTSQPVVKPTEKKKKKGGTKKHDDDFYFDSYVPTYIPSPTPTKVTTRPSTPTVDPAKKQAACKKIANQCMSDIGSKIIGLSGSSYEAAAKAYGDTCNRQYKSCMR